MLTGQATATEAASGAGAMQRNATEVKAAERIKWRQ